MGETRTTVTSVSGTVASFETGKSITVTRPDGTKVTYIINPTGTVCALLAIAPTVLAHGGRFPTASLMALLLAVALTGILVSRLAVAAIHRSPLLAGLRAE